MEYDVVVKEQAETRQKKEEAERKMPGYHD